MLFTFKAIRQCIFLYFIFWNFHISQIHTKYFLFHIFHFPINRSDYVYVSLLNILRVIMYEWMSNCPFVCVSFHPSFVLSRLGLFDISHYWISHKAFAILQWPFISYIFLMVYRIPLLILRSRILKYKICVFFVFYTFVFGLYFIKPFITIPNEPTGASITFEVKSSKTLVTKLALIPYCRCCV